MCPDSEKSIARKHETFMKKMEMLTLSGDGCLTLALGAAGEARMANFGLAAPCAASLFVTEKTLTLNLPAGNAGGVITLTAPSGFRHDGKTPNVKLAAKKGQYELTLPAGVTKLTLIK